MRQPTHAERYAAIKRGLDFIYRTAGVEENFKTYGHDYLCCFQCIAATSKNQDLRRRARTMGRERARHWREQNSEVPPDADADDIANLVFGGDAADRLGIRQQGFRTKLRNVAGQFTALDYFGFDAANEPPPYDVPDDCDCGAGNPRGRKTCRECRKRLAMLSPYGVWLDAIIRSYHGEKYGVLLGATFADVLKWLPAMRPYPIQVNDQDAHFFWAIYAITHLVYTLNDYSTYTLSPRWLPEEFAFLKGNLSRAIGMEDSETVGEFLDALKAFKLGEDHPLILTGVNYLLANQHPDGSWGDLGAEDIYARYHPTWTAIDGLREYAWRGDSPRIRKYRALLKTQPNQR